MTCPDSGSSARGRDITTEDRAGAAGPGALARREAFGHLPADEAFDHPFEDRRCEHTAATARLRRDSGDGEAGDRADHEVAELHRWPQHRVEAAGQVVEGVEQPRLRPDSAFATTQRRRSPSGRRARRPPPPATSGSTERRAPGSFRHVWTVRDGKVAHVPIDAVNVHDGRCGDHASPAPAAPRQVELGRARPRRPPPAARTRTSRRRRARGAPPRVDRTSRARGVLVGGADRRDVAAIVPPLPADTPVTVEAALYAADTDELLGRVRRAAGDGGVRVAHRSQPGDRPGHSP